MSTTPHALHDFPALARASHLLYYINFTCNRKVIQRKCRMLRHSSGLCIVETKSISLYADCCIAYMEKYDDWIALYLSDSSLLLFRASEGSWQPPIARLQHSCPVERPYGIQTCGEDIYVYDRKFLQINPAGEIVARFNLPITTLFTHDTFYIGKSRMPWIDVRLSLEQERPVAVNAATEWKAYVYNTTHSESGFRCSVRLCKHQDNTGSCLQKHWDVNKDDSDQRNDVAYPFSDDQLKQLMMMTYTMQLVSRVNPTIIRTLEFMDIARIHDTL